MARRRFDDFRSDDDDFSEFFATDAADQAFWDEFWNRESVKDEEAPLVTITIRNEETGEERVVEKVRLRFRTLKKLRG
ncbi:hypothetical protein IH980_05780 [Patescibacteria group bacterium]|nr:hypothetical protein [Patescibacteria group bacterium]